jgi:hypothetical protein
MNSAAVVEASSPPVRTLQEERVAAAERRLHRANDALRAFMHSNAIMLNGMLLISTAHASRVALDRECVEAQLEFSRALSALSEYSRKQ